MTITAVDIIGGLSAAGVGGGIKWAVDRFLAARKEAREAHTAEKAQSAEQRAAERREKAAREETARTDEMARERRAVEALVASAAAIERISAAFEKNAEALASINATLNSSASTLTRIDARSEADDRAFTDYRASTVAHREEQGTLLAEARAQLVALTAAMARIEALVGSSTSEHRASIPTQGDPRV